MSLGFNCFGKMLMVRSRLANSKREGGKTFPFDAALHFDTD
jgi:hypothetical protein